MMDIELQNVKDPSRKIICTVPHWETVLKPQGLWEPVEKAKEQPLLIPQEEEAPPKKKTRKKRKKKSA